MAHTPEPQGATGGSQGRVADDATRQLLGGTLGGVGHPGAGEGATEHSQCPRDAARLFSCPGCTFPKDIGAAWVRLAQVQRFPLPPTSKTGMQRQQESSRKLGKTLHFAFPLLTPIPTTSQDTIASIMSHIPGPAHLRAERCLLMEVAVHELAVFPRRDLAAGQRAGSRLAQGRAHSPSPPPKHPPPLPAAGPAATVLPTPLRLRNLPLLAQLRTPTGQQQAARQSGELSPGRVPPSLQLTCPWCRCSRACP